MSKSVSAVLVKEEIVDAFNWRIKQKDLGIIWYYRIWEYTDADGNTHLYETSDGMLNFFFFSIQLFGDGRDIKDRHALT